MALAENIYAEYPLLPLSRKLKSIKIQNIYFDERLGSVTSSMKISASVTVRKAQPLTHVSPDPKNP